MHKSSGCKPYNDTETAPQEEDNSTEMNTVYSLNIILKIIKIYIFYNNEKIRVSVDSDM